MPTNKTKDSQLPEDFPAQLNKPEVAAYSIEAHGPIPNNPTLPLLVYKGAVTLPDEDPSAALAQVFRHNNWHKIWRNDIYDYHHYHSTAHEVIGVFSGSARVRFGGDPGPLVEMAAGDVVVIPAGVAHKKISSTADFGVVGAYPESQDWDMNFGEERERADADRNIEEVGLPAQDPLYGTGGPLLEHWSA